MAKTERRTWHSIARRDQLPPTDCEWRTYLVTAGRGWGKGRAGAEWLVDQAATHPGTSWAVVGNTLWDVLKICLEGNSGVVKACAPDELESFSPSQLRVRLTNGSLIRGFSSQGLASMRGEVFDGAWMDEVLNLHAVWNTISFAVTGHLMVTTTPPDDLPLPLPRPGQARQLQLLEFLRNLAACDDTVHVNGSTWENAVHLSPATLAELRRRYAGTRMVEGVL